MTPVLHPAAAEDAEALADLRLRAMRPSLEAVGRFDPDRARARFLDAFDPSATWHIVLNGDKVGVLVLRRRDDHLRLDHLYIEPQHQGAGLGGHVLAHVFAEAVRLNLPVRVGALKGSRSNAFYIAHGFRLGACRAWGAESENRPQRADFLPDSPPHSQAMGQEDGEKAAAAVDLQPATPKPDRLLVDSTDWDNHYTWQPSQAFTSSMPAV